jgi:hypothetical protein
VNGKTMMHWLGNFSPFTIYSFFRYAPCAMRYAILTGPQDQVFFAQINLQKGLFVPP